VLGKKPCYHRIAARIVAHHRHNSSFLKSLFGFISVNRRSLVDFARHTPVSGEVEENGLPSFSKLRKLFFRKSFPAQFRDGRLCYRRIWQTGPTPRKPVIMRVLPSPNIKLTGACCRLMIIMPRSMAAAAIAPNTQPAPPTN
jgi:hypothetical protein